jgi:hypothetical protein
MALITGRCGQDLKTDRGAVTIGIIEGVKIPDVAPRTEVTIESVATLGNGNRNRRRRRRRHEKKAMIREPLEPPIITGHGEITRPTDRRPIDNLASDVPDYRTIRALLDGSLLISTSINYENGSCISESSTGENRHSKKKINRLDSWAA